MMIRGKNLLSLALAVGTVSGFADLTQVRGLQQRRSLYSLQQVTFVDECYKELTSDALTFDGMVSQDEFAETWFFLCENFQVEENCSADLKFDDLPEVMQAAFIYGICMDDKITDCEEKVISLRHLGEFGYSTPIDDSMVMEMCVELEAGVFGEEESSGIDLNGVNVDPPTVLGVTADTFNVAGAATLGSATLLLLYLAAGGRFKKQRLNEKGLKSDRSFQTVDSPDTTLPDTEDGLMMYLASTSKKTGTTDVDKVQEAINTANWGMVEKLASKLAEREDFSTISSVGSQSVNRTTLLKLRAHLSPVDQAHAKSLDKHVSRGDWSAVARAASLYASRPTSKKSSSSKYMSKAAETFTEVSLS